MRIDESPAGDAQDASPVEDTTPQASPSGDADADTAPTPARRRAAAPRTRRKKETPAEAESPLPTDSADAPAAAEIPPAELVPAAAPETEAPAKPRRTRARKTAVAAPEAAAAAVDAPGIASEEAAVVAAVESAPADAEPPTEESAAGEPPAEKPAPKPRRSRSRKTVPPPADILAEGVSETVEAAADAVTETPSPRDVDSVSAEAESVPADAAPPATKAPSRRRGGRRRQSAQTLEAPVSESAEVLETVASVVESAAEALLPTPEADSGSPADVTTKSPSRRSRSRRSAENRTRARQTPEPVEPPVPTVDYTKGARVVTRQGVTELLIKGVSVPPIFFFGSMEGPKETRRVVSEVQRAAKAGVHIHSTLIELPCPIPSDDSVYEVVDQRIQALLDADPQGYVLPRLVFVPVPGWMRQYPNEVVPYADGDQPSLASDKFWQEAGDSLENLITHIQRTTYAERIIGYHLERGEWFHPADSGFDRSFANREAFRSWLRVKYRNSEAALRAAWFDGQIQFYTVEIPALPAARPEIAFYEPRKQRALIDFLEFTSELTADRLIGLAQVVKKVTENLALVSLCYGYTFEFAHTFSGHLALGRLLQSDSVDIIAGPPSYRDRLPGEAGSLPSPAGSFRLHGKLFVSENDTKTFLAPPDESPDDFNPRVDSRFGTEQVHLRAIGQALAGQTGVAWMDTWGEGWLDSDDIWQRISGFSTRFQRVIENAKQIAAASPDVVVLVDERSLLHVQRGDTFVRRLLQEQREIIQRSGASVGFYLQNDVVSPAFPTDAKMYVFLNPYRVTAEQRAAISEKLQNSGKTLVWMYAVGVCSANGEPDEGAHEIVGITLRRQSWNAEIGSRIADGRHIITERITNRLIGQKERLNPSYAIDDESRSVTVLANYQQSGLPSVAVKTFNSWKSVFCGEPLLNAELFRGLCRFADVPLYTPGTDDYVYAGSGFVTLHSVRDGSRPLTLPRSSALYDLSDGRLLIEQTRDFRLTLRAKATRSFFAGTLEEMRALGLTNLSLPRPSAPPVVFREERAGAPPLETTRLPGTTDSPADAVRDAVDDTPESDESEETLTFDLALPLPPAPPRAPTYEALLAVFRDVDAPEGAENLAPEAASNGVGDLLPLLEEGLPLPESILPRETTEVHEEGYTDAPYSEDDDLDDEENEDDEETDSEIEVVPPGGALDATEEGEAGAARRRRRRGGRGRGRRRGRGNGNGNAGSNTPGGE